MSDYIFAYYGTMEPQDPEKGAEGRAKFQSWLEGLGEAVINPGTPLRITKAVTSGGVSDDAALAALTGFSIIRAESMEAALEMAKDCPFLEMGSVEVGEVMKM